VNSIEFDYSMALCFKNDIVPSAIMYYLGEVDDEDDEDDEDYDVSGVHLVVYD